ncbi:MAG: hypothetical protein PSV16_01125 [Flavobacterium sp.]|nr:hypothetical protein [Flavobacterium sp.]
MELTKNQKVLIGFLHFLPILGMALYFIVFFSIFFSAIGNAGNHEPNPVVFFQGFAAAFIIIILTIFATIGIKIFDIMHVVKSNKNDTGNKVLMWVLLFVFAGTISEIIYYFMEILPNKTQEIQNTQQ